MNTKGLFTILTLTMLYACGKETVTPEPNLPGETPIVPGTTNLEAVAFSVESISEGRAVEMTKENLVSRGNKIELFAYEHIGGIDKEHEIYDVYNFPIEYNGSKWHYSPLLYWPVTIDTMYSFVGIYPNSADCPEQINCNYRDDLSIDFNIGSDIYDQIDLLYAVSRNNTAKGGDVEFHFKHALSKVVFSASCGIDNPEIDSVCITNVELKGIAKSGNFTIDSELENVKWLAAKTTRMSILSSSKKISNVSTQLEGSLYLIPQDIETSPIEVVLSYAVYTNSLSVPQIGVETFVLPVSSVSAWEANHTYDYSFDITLNSLEFNVDVNVKEFESGADVDMNVSQSGSLSDNGGELNVIYYKTIDGKIIEPNPSLSDNELWGGAQIVSNTYENGYGEIVFDDVVTRIPNSAFYSGDWNNNSTLLEIILPKSVTEIGNGAFERCVYLTDITIPDSLTKIGAWAFNECAGLTSVYIPKSVTYIDKKAFSFWEYRRNIESIIVHEDNPVYDSRKNCNAIIETQTDKMIVACNSTIIPDGIVTIGYNAFTHCSLSECVLPNSVELIDTNAFGYSEISEIVLSESLVSIYSDAFWGCHLSEVVIPCSVEYIGRGAFSSVDILSLESTTPCRIESDFMTKSYTIINVPEGAIDNYANADGWVAYRHMINGFVEPEMTVVNEIVDTIQIVYDEMGYTGTTYSFAIEEIYNAFGVGEESLQKEIEAGRFDYYAEDSEGTLHQANGNTEFSSWWGDNGKVTVWGADAKIFFEGETPNVYTVGQYPGHCEIGTVYPTSHLFTYFSNGENKAIRVKVDVEIVE